MTRRGLVGKIGITPESEVTEALTVDLYASKWQRREKLSAIKKKRIYIPLSPLQLNRLDNYLENLRKYRRKRGSEGHPIFQGHTPYVGLLELKVSHEKKHIQWHGFDPFEELILEKRDSGYGIPSGVGIGDLVHYATVKHLAAKYKGYTISHYKWSVEPERVKQLARMGIDIGKTYKLREYHDKVRTYIEKVRREKRATKPL